MDRVNETAVKSKGAPASGVGVLDKSVALLAFLAEGGPASLAAVVAATGVSRPTAHRLLAALEAHHLVVRRNSRYALGLRLLGWGEKAAAGSSLVELARPALERLRDATGESVQLYVREGDHRVCVASFERTGGGLRDAVPVGAVLTLERGSGGRVLRACAESGDTGGGGAEVEEELAEVRQRGWAESIAEREPGVASVSAPVFGPGGELWAAVCASGPDARLGESPGGRLAGAVVSAAREIEAALRA